MLFWKDLITYAKYGNPEPPRRVRYPEAEWALRLPPARYKVLRTAATEPPYRNAYCRTYEPGTYACAGCGSHLFAADEKYHAISGWPSFRQPATRAAVAYYVDTSFNMQRMEARCNVCDGHLGHVFADGPAPGGLRYCINSASLVLRVAAAEATNDAAGTSG